MGRRGRNSPSTFELVNQENSGEIKKIPPFALSEEGVQIYQRTAEVLGKVLTQADEWALARYSSYCAEWLELSAYVAKEGLYVESYNKAGECYQAQRPEATRLVHLEKFIARLEKDLGLTPAARGTKAASPKNTMSERVMNRNKLFGE